jgi:hypothetical protein
MELIVIIIILAAIITFTCEGLPVLLKKASPYFISIGDNIYLIGGLAALIVSAYILIYFKPHPAEKEFEKYQRGLISREAAIKNIANTMYNYKRDNIPSVRTNKKTERQLNALRKRVKAETQFINDLREYIKAKERV